jgi:type I restriction enzyme M protein
MVERLSNLVGIFQKPELDFSDNRAENDDILGDAYEYLMRHFATESGKSKGQFYTPSEVSRVIAKVIGISPHNAGARTTAYDPTCGSGSLLLKVAAEAGKHITLEGQEKDVTTAGLARMNMILHDFPTANILAGNTLAEPEVQGRQKLRTYDYVVANPPFSTRPGAPGLTPETDPFQRFAWGEPPAKQGDYAYLLHIIRSMKGTAKAACILPHGVLFRGNAEAVIRKQLVAQRHPQGHHRPAGQPVLRHRHPGLHPGAGQGERRRARKGVIHDRRQQGLHQGRQQEPPARAGHPPHRRHLHQRQADVPRYARLVPLAEIADAKNDFNLNLPRYIDSSEPEDLHDITAHLRGGIPARDLDDPASPLAAYWQVLPGVRQGFFESAGHAGYVQLKLPLPELKAAILGHAEFQAFNQKATQRFADWRAAATQRLRPSAQAATPRR